MPVKADSKITRRPGKDLHLPYGMTLAARVRGDKCELISGMTQIEAGDFVVVFCLTGMFHKVEKWFG